MTTRMTLDDLPPRLREQALAQLAIQPRPSAPPTAPRHTTGSHRGPNKTELRFNREVLGGRGIYEGITYHLPGGSRYTPDYIVREDGIETAYEVKGSYRFPSEGRALTAFREARAAWPQTRFRWFRRSKDGWQECHIDI